MRSVLITGSSTGIGHATALRLHRAGFAVYATARRPETLADLAELGITTLALDVTDEASMTAAVDRVVADHGAVDVLVNNAGYALAETVEEAPAEAVRAQFETNVFGPSRLIQLVLPGMRARRSGHIVNLSSIFGRFAVPGAGYYDATKHALEAISDALRLEVAPFGIQVVLVQPGPVRTRLAAASQVRRPGLEEGPYADFHRTLAASTSRAYDDSAKPPSGDTAARRAIDPDDVARTIERALTARQARSRYPVGSLARTLLLLRRWLPSDAFDAFVRSKFPTPQLETPDSRDRAG